MNLPDLGRELDKGRKPPITQKGMDNIVRWALIIIVSIGFALFTLNIMGCRENITYVNDIEYTYEVCDTISKKQIPGTTVWKYTIRCTDAEGNERIYYVEIP